MPGTYSCISSLMLLGLPISLEGEDSGWFLAELLEGAGSYLFEGQRWGFLWLEICDEDIWLGVIFTFTGVHLNILLSNKLSEVEKKEFSHWLKEIQTWISRVLIVKWKIIKLFL